MERLIAYMNCLEYSIALWEYHTLRDFGCAHILLHACLHVLQRVTSRGNFIVANNQRVSRAKLVGQLHRPLELSFYRQLDAEAGAAKVPRQQAHVTERRFSQRRDEQVESRLRLRAFH